MASGLTLAVALVAGCASSPGTTTVHGLEPYPNSTATDWVTYADHVVVATVTAEREMPLDDHEKETGEGSVDREVTLHADEIIWSADDPVHAAPEGEFTMPGFGWTLADGEKTEMVAEGAPRLEVGHSYIFALYWLPEVPDEPVPVPARWNSLGLSAVVPFDDGIIGNGEVMGEVVSPSQQRDLHETPAEDEPALEQTLAGEDITELESTLATTKPGVPEDY
jgi:hypothetical protein